MILKDRHRTRLSLEWFADQFALIESKGRRIFQIQANGFPEWLKQEADGGAFWWGADLVLDPSLKGGTIVLMSKGDPLNPRLRNSRTTLKA